MGRFDGDCCDLDDDFEFADFEFADFEFDFEFDNLVFSVFSVFSLVVKINGGGIEEVEMVEDLVVFDEVEKYEISPIDDITSNVVVVSNSESE